MKVQPAVRQETRKIALGTGILAILMVAVFLILRRFDWTVLTGALLGWAAAVGNFFLMALIATRIMNRALEHGKQDEVVSRVKATASFRLLGCLGLCVILIAVFKTNVFSTLIPLLFPRIGIAFRPMIDRKRGVESPGTEGSDLID